MARMTPLQMARLVDYALLEPELAREDIERGCELAARYRCFSITVKPHYIELARRLLKDTGVKLGTVVGYPHGGSTTAVKMFEASDAIQRGAEEIDLVMNLGALRDQENLAVQNDIAVVVKSSRGHPVKAIIETDLLTVEEIGRACRLAEAAGASFIVTSTGLGVTTVAPRQIELIRESLQTNVRIKAAGGINTWSTAMKMVQAGADRLGVSQIERVLGCAG